MGKLSLLKEMWDFLKIRKKWWLYPIILFLVLIAALVIFVSSSTLAPILYPLF
jgi:hypothetical protein